MPRRADADNVLKLTRAVIPRLALDEGQSEKTFWDSDLPGFGLRMRGTRGTWVIRPPRAGGKSLLVTIGGADIIDVTEARKAAQEKLAKAHLGEDIRPAHRREQQPDPAAVLLGAIFDRYAADAERRMRRSSLANLRTHLNRHFFELRDRPLTGLKRADVATAIRGIAESSGPFAALRARRTLSSVYAWAVGEGLCEFNPVVGTNAPTEEVRRDRVLSDAEIVAVWRACPATDDFGRIVRILALTGQRRDEVAAMQWAEIDLDRAVWTIPAARAKNKREHVVALSGPVLEILAGVPRIVGRNYVFGSGAGGYSGFSRSKARLDATLGFRDPWRLHDLRRTAATGMGDIGVLPHVVESALNHVSGFRAGVAGTYQRQLYRVETRDALERWATHVVALTGGQ